MGFGMGPGMEKPAKKPEHNSPAGHKPHYGEKSPIPKPPYAPPKSPYYNPVGPGKKKKK